MAEELYLSPPWVTYVHELEALFARDDDVNVIYEEGGDQHRVKVTCATQKKYDAWAKLLPACIDFGGVQLPVTVVPPNGETINYEQVIRDAFEGNAAFVDAISVDAPLMRSLYVLFDPVVVQIQNDDISNPYGLTSVLYEDIANDVLAVDPSVSFTTARV